MYTKLRKTRIYSPLFFQLFPSSQDCPIKGLSRASFTEPHLSDLLELYIVKQRHSRVTLHIAKEAVSVK